MEMSTADFSPFHSGCTGSNGLGLFMAHLLLHPEDVLQCILAVKETGVGMAFLPLTASLACGGSYFAYI